MYDVINYLYFPKYIKQHNCFQYYWQYMFIEQHIIMISEGSCDTEDRNNYAENSAFHYRNKFHFKLYS